MVTGNVLAMSNSSASFIFNTAPHTGSFSNYKRRTSSLCAFHLIKPIEDSSKVLYQVRRALLSILYSSAGRKLQTFLENKVIAFRLESGGD